MRCHYCEWRCELGMDRFGVCKMYYSDGETIRERFPRRWCSFGVIGIEAIPFYHVYPGSRCMTIGTGSCNFHCRYCSNAFIAKRDPLEMEDELIDLTPADMVKTARKLGCHHIVFNVNEPAVSLDSLGELAREANDAGIRMGCLTNGYTTPESTELLASIFSFFNISLKGLSPEFNREYIGIPSVEPVLRTIRQLAAIRHVELATPVIQGVNDHELEQMAGLIAEIDPEIPWHVFRLLPEDEMKDSPYPGISSVNALLEPAREKLAHVYFHNFVGSEWVNTLCPSCGSVVIERFSLGCGGDKLQRYLCRGARCASCGREIRLLGERVAWDGEGGLS